MKNQDVNIALDVLPRLNAYNAISLAINTSVHAIIGYTGENSRAIVSIKRQIPMLGVKMVKPF
jgi:hypothetical protein